MSRENGATKMAYVPEYKIHQFRSRFLEHEIPLPGWVEPPDDASEIFVLPGEHDEPVFTCDKKWDDGSRRNKQFST